MKRGVDAREAELRIGMKGMGLAVEEEWAKGGGEILRGKSRAHHITVPAPPLSQSRLSADKPYTSLLSPFSLASIYTVHFPVRHRRL